MALPLDAMRPLLYQIKTQVVLQEQPAGLGRPTTLDDLPDAPLDELAAQGVEWAWFQRGQ